MWILRLLSYLPLPALYAFSELMAFLTYHVVRYRRNVVHKNLRNAFPEKTPHEIARLARDFYRDLCDYAVETLKLMSLTEKEIKERMICATPEIEQTLREEKGMLVYLTSHQFNWEWMLQAVVLNGKIDIHYVYQPQSSKFFDDFSNHLRQRFGAKAVRRDQVGREAIRLRGTRYVLAILADQFPGLDHDKRHWTSFLNQDTAFFAGSIALAVRMKSKIYFFYSRKIQRGYYEYFILPMDQPPYSTDEKGVADLYAKALEKSIRTQPHNWLWSHNRWKRTRQEMGDA